jgi:hypothetical protein
VKPNPTSASSFPLQGAVPTGAHRLDPENVSKWIEAGRRLTSAMGEKLTSQHHWPGFAQVAQPLPRGGAGDAAGVLKPPLEIACHRNSLDKKIRKIRCRTSNSRTTSANPGRSEVANFSLEHGRLVGRVPLLLAHLEARHRCRRRACPHWGVKRTSLIHDPMSANDP